MKWGMATRIFRRLHSCWNTACLHPAFTTQFSISTKLSPFRALRVNRHCGCRKLELLHGSKRARLITAEGTKGSRKARKRDSVCTGGAHFLYLTQACGRPQPGLSGIAPPSPQNKTGLHPMVQAGPSSTPFLFCFWFFCSVDAMTSGSSLSSDKSGGKVC